MDLKEIISGDIGFQHSLTNEIRFTANDKTKKVYMWNAYLETHWDVERKLNVDHLKDDFILSGIAYYKKGNLVFFESDSLDYQIGKEGLRPTNNVLKLLDRNWFWLKRYMDISLLDKYREKVKRKEQIKRFREMEKYLK
jgi:hypothetical protein